MPAKSKAQFQFMKAVASGNKRVKGLSPEQAKEYVTGQSPKGLPAKKTTFKKLRKKLKA